VDIEETEPLILEALRASEPLTKTELYERIEKNKTIVSKAVDLLTENEQIIRSGSGKKNDAYKYSALLPSDTNEGAKAETKTASKHTKSKESFCLDDSELFSPTGERPKAETNEAFSAQKQPQKLTPADVIEAFAGSRILSREKPREEGDGEG
jgi:predicted transcriptional regulator